MEKIKVLRIIARLNVGGPAIHTILLTQGLNSNRFESLLVCGQTSSGEGDMSYYALERKVDFRFIPELTREIRFKNDIISIKKIYQLLWEFQPDIVHTHTAKAGTAGRCAGILYNLTAKNKVILVHTFHGHVFQGYFTALIEKAFLYIERFMALFTSKIITVSESVKEELAGLRIAQSEKIQVIPLGLELSNFLDIAPIYPAANRLKIGIVGRLVPIKNHRMFLDAVSLLIKNNPKIDLACFIIGDGQLRTELEGYSQKLRIAQQIKFAGWQNNLSEIYADLDILALTSLNEGTPVSLIEAMAAARIVVATDVGGVRDLLGKVTFQHDAGFQVLERGIIAPSGDVHAFTRALEYVLNNPQIRQELSLKAREFVRNGFAKDRLLKDIENLYSSLVASKHKIC